MKNEFKELKQDEMLEIEGGAIPSLLLNEDFMEFTAKVAVAIVDFFVN